MSYPLYLSQFRTSEISGYTRILLKTIQKRAELATLRQQHFLYQHKILYNPISARSSSGETDTEDNHRWQFFLTGVFYFDSGLTGLCFGQDEASCSFFVCL